MANKKVLVTAALPYINNVPHMGHIVGSHLPADIFYRYCKAKGMDAAFIGGSDEHGTPSAIAAKQLGIRPEELVGKLHHIHKSIYEKMDISYSNYSRTSSKAHHKTVQDFFQQVMDKGYIYTQGTEMFFCETEQMFLPDRFVVGKCPKCGYEEANGDQCEQCATVLTPTSLVKPRCKSCGSTPSFKETEQICLDLERISGPLKKWIETKEDVWRPHVFGEAMKWMDEGLRGRSISREMDWGIPIPLKGFENKVFYVWFEAPIAYISFTKELGEDAFCKYWKDPDATVVHFLGKDNIPFHTVFWPAMLLAHGEFNLPSNVVGYNYLNYKGKKFSKSKGVGVFCYNLLQSDIDIDMLRGYLTTVIPETNDSSFDWQGFKTHVNGEFIGKVGNFFNRTISLAWDNFQGRLSASSLRAIDNADAAIIEAIRTMPENIGNSIFSAELRRAYSQVMQFAGAGHAYIAAKAPWNLVKTDPEEAKKVLYLALNLARSLAITAAPFIPKSMEKVWREQLHLDQKPGSPGIWDSAKEIGNPGEYSSGEPIPLYKRIDDATLSRLEKEFSKPHSLEKIVRE